MCKKFCFLFLFIVFLFSDLIAQNKFEFDYARFYSNADSSGYIELYYSFYQPALKVVQYGDMKLNQGELDVEITDKLSKETVVDRNWQFDLPINQKGKNENLTGVLRFPLDLGHYSVKLTAKDVNNAEFKEVHNFELILNPTVKRGISISDIELASSIKQDSKDTQSIFYKNTLEVTPNPSLIFGDSNPVLFFYAEIYGLDNSEYNEFIVEQKLLDYNNKEQYQKSRVLKNPKAAIVEVGAIKANNLNSGVYSLVISVRDVNNHLSVNSAKRVYLYNKELIDQTTSFASKNMSPLEAELMVLSEDELNFMFETARYIASETEKTQWEKLVEIDAKKRFLANFWHKRDYDLSTPENEYKRDFYERVKYANQHYGNVSRREGWKTDRGRVYVTYGEPSLIERFQNEYYSEPYEIWTYESIENGVIFLFADEEGLNIYRLVHSTKTGEISNYNQYRKYVQ